MKLRNVLAKQYRPCTKSALQRELLMDEQVIKFKMGSRRRTYVRWEHAGGVLDDYGQSRQRKRVRPLLW